ncbi:MAG TPA: serine hydrolase [Holophagaceae bacterium]|nr:serine hydrolase [Holophagaceae bacterium]
MAHPFRAFLAGCALGLLSPALRAGGESTPAHKRTALNLRSAEALVLDQRTGEVLYDKQGETLAPMASITKLMTAMVVLDANLDLKEELRIEKADVDTLRHSKSRLPVGTRLTRGEALLLALLASENRAAHALGRTYPGGLTACVAAMNAKAQALGLKRTRYEDPTGLDGGNVATARELATIVDTAHRYPVIRDFSTRGEAEIGSGRRRIAFLNTNGLTRNHRWTIGLSKTGYLEEAGKCLVMQTNLAGRALVIVLLDSWGKYTRLGDAARIRQWLEGPAPAAVRTSRRKRRG